MIIVTGSITVKPENIDAALALSLEHVKRSRLENGCISHAVNIDAEHATTLFFYEQWADNQVLLDHFAVPKSQQFAASLTELAEQAPQLNIYEAQKTR